MQILVLSFLTKQITQELFTFLYRLTKSIGVSTYIVAIVFVLGTLIHELSHFLMAKLLFVHAEKLELMPERTGDTVKLGSVQVAKADPIRRLLIGVAPFLVGCSLMFTIIWYGIHIGAWQDFLLAGSLVFLLFEIANTMFSSKRDLEGVLEFLGIVGVLLILFVFFTKVDLLQYVNSFSFITPLLLQGCTALLVPVGLDIVALFLFKVLNRAFL